MLIKLTKMRENAKVPFRAYSNDVGADVYAAETVGIPSGHVKAVGLGFGVEIPNGYLGMIAPRSGLTIKGIICQIPMIDPGYEGEIHAIVMNFTDHEITVEEGDRIGQLVMCPCVTPEFIWHDQNIPERGSGGFGSTGIK